MVACEKAKVAKPVADAPDVSPTPHPATLPDTGVVRSKAQLVYAPVYSNLRSMEDAGDYLVSANLSIRNTSLDKGIKIHFVDYYNHKGKLVRNYLKEPLEIEPLASINYFVKLSDREGGVGAKFLIEWSCSEAITMPVIETVMMESSGNRGFAFKSRAVVLRDVRE